MRIGSIDYDLENEVLIMGILNVTPDSFYDGGKYNRIDKALKHAAALVEEGAHIIDIGGESTRPGSEGVSASEETDRVIPVIEALVHEFSILISIDTTKSAVAEAALYAGAAMVNDISALRFDKNLGDVVARYGVPVVLMHMLGKPKDMQINPSYCDVIEEVKVFFKNRINFAQSCGILEDNIILDPGIGFGKKLEHNLKLFSELAVFKKMGFPILVGPSRKSFIGMILQVSPGHEDRLMGTAAVVAAAVLNGASLVRVHDVKAMREVVEVALAIRDSKHFEV